MKCDGSRHDGDAGLWLRPFLLDGPLGIRIIHRARRLGIVKAITSLGTA
jgi:hypothetical protein